MTVDELADRLRAAREGAPQGHASGALVLFGMKHSAELDALAVKRDTPLGRLDRMAGLRTDTRTEIYDGRQLTRYGHATLNEDTLWS